jgi:hypothetical protein
MVDKKKRWRNGIMLKLLIAFICACFVSANYEKESVNNVNAFGLLTSAVLLPISDVSNLQEIPVPIITLYEVRRQGHFIDI